MADHQAWEPETLQALRELEDARDRYLLERDPIAARRLAWRARTVRNLVHLRRTDRVLELGSGRGLFTPHLEGLVDPGHLTSISFADGGAVPPGELFDVAVVNGLLDRRTTVPLLRRIFDHLAPGGQVVFFQSNPWNPILRVRRAVSRGDTRQLQRRSRLYERMSEVGFIEVLAEFTDFMYRPLTPRFIWLLRNLSLVLENMPMTRSLAGTILLVGRKPPKGSRTPVPLASHPALRGRVSVVVPCHNEEDNVRPLYDGLVGYYGDYLRQLVFVDDNSSDRTAVVLEALRQEDARVVVVRREPPSGVGRALRSGLQAADGDWVLMMDCDFQHLLPDIRDLFDATAHGFDVVVGSRFSRESVLVGYPVQKIIANRGFHLVARVVLGCRFRDLTNNLRLLRREVVDSVIVAEDGFAANAEIGLLPLAMGFSVCEVPISWINRGVDMGESSFNVAAVGGGYWRVLRQLALARYFRRGRYATLAMPRRLGPTGRS